MLLVLDSGVGGLTVTDALRRMVPDLPMAFLADTGGFPYGDRPDAALTERLVGLVGRAVARVRPRAVLVACNTASTVALGALRDAHPLPFIGCVPPIKPAARLSRSRCIGLLATPATVRRPYVEALAGEFAADCRVWSHGAPTLASLAEAAFRGEAVAPAAVRAELRGLFDQPGADAIDAVALGCTHYAFLLPELRRAAPGVAHWLDPAEPVARRTLAVLEGVAPVAGFPAGTALTTAALDDAAAAGFARHGFNRCQAISAA